MTCPNFLIWRPIPDDCMIKAQSIGNDEDYNALIAVRRNGTQESPIRHHELDPGSAARPIGSTDRVTLNAALSVFRDLNQPVTLDIWVEDAAGHTIDVDDGKGGTTPARCQWGVAKTAMSPQFIEVRLRGGAL